MKSKITALWDAGQATISHLLLSSIVSFSEYVVIIVDVVVIAVMM